MNIFEHGWWIPLHAKKPDKGFGSWKQRQLSLSECIDRYEAGSDLGLRPASLGAVCVDVDREGGVEVIESMCSPYFASYGTTKGWHYYFRYTGEPFGFRKWQYGEVFHNNYVWVRQPEALDAAYGSLDVEDVLVINDLPELGKTQRDQDGNVLTSIVPRWSEEQAERGRAEGNKERRFRSTLNEVAAMNLHDEGWPKAEIARKLRLSYSSVKKYLKGRVREKGVHIHTVPYKTVCESPPLTAESKNPFLEFVTNR